MDKQKSQRTDVVFASEARKRLFKGIKIAADAVGCTLGPRGKTVLIQKGNLPPVVTKDGVTVAKSIDLNDPMKRLGARLIIEAATHANDAAGDGTTTATILTYAMIAGALKLIESGRDASRLAQGISTATELVVNELKGSAIQISTDVEVEQVATISANGDSLIGKVIAQAVKAVGPLGVVTVEDAKGTQTALELVEGMQVDRGFVSPYFVTNQERMLATYQDAYVLIVGQKLNNVHDLVPLLEKVLRTQKPLLLIADEIEGDALQGLVLNRVKGNLPIVAIKSPGYGLHKEELLNDMCALTGASLVSTSTGLSLSKVELQHLGIAGKVIVGARSTILVGTGKTKDAVAAHLADLVVQLQDVTLDIDAITKLRARISKLSGGAAIIRVGGSTELEMIERKYRIEDALNATRAAMEEGIVPGGGCALVTASTRAKKAYVKTQDGDVDAGADELFAACAAPLRRIVTNAGLSPDVVIGKIVRTVGFNAATGEFCEMFESGIIDPVKVTRTALTSASSVAVTFASLDAVVCEDERSS